MTWRELAIRILQNADNLDNEVVVAVIERTSPDNVVVNVQVAPINFLSGHRSSINIEKSQLKTSDRFI